MGHILTLNLDNTVKFYADSKDHSVAIKENHCKVVEAWDAAKLVCHKENWEVEKVKEVHLVSQLARVTSMETLKATLADQYTTLT